jgi:GR25 family glycosyltransferase involved in LPS biosynthesis
MTSISCKMIVYKKSKERVDNFNKTKQIFNDLEMFDAIDGINMYNKYKQYALENNFVNDYFIDDCEGKRDNRPKYGILGCLLSHVLILKEFVEKSDKEWLFVMEDDTTLSNFNPKIFDYLIDNATKNDSHFIQLFTNPRFYERQINTQKYNFGLYRMIRQWHTSALMISKKGALKILSNMPFKQAIDMEIMDCIDSLNALCFVNNIFVCKGALGPQDNNSEYGSLLWNIKPS